MRHRIRFDVLLPLGLGLILLLLFVGAPAYLSAQEPAPSGQDDTQITLPANPTALPAGDDLPMTRWISLDGSQPTTFAEWQAQQPPPSPRHVERVYASEISHAGPAADQVVCVLVNPAIYDGISASLAQWTADVEADGWSVAIYSASFPDPPALRSHLASIADLEGCLLIGDFPVPWYELDSKQFPMDVYYMDLDGLWLDDDLDGLYDDHTGDVAPEIWIGRMLAGNLTFGRDEIGLLNNYFVKNHAYRTGDLVLPARALVYIDDDWARGADSQGEVMSLLYPDTTVISEPNTTRAMDYGQRLVDYYAWIHLLAHSTASSHSFTYHEGETLHRDGIFNDNIHDIDPHGFFYNLFACGAARFIEPDYIAGWYIFADSYGLVALGSTTSGSMVRGFPLFHGLLAQGEAWGQAYLGWFEVYGVADKGWHYGLALLGDPTLTVKTQDPVGEAPASVTVAGPATGDVRSVYTFSATVDPDGATQPLMYSWDATGQLPVRHKSGQNDAASFIWWNSPGTKVITVTAANFEGSVSNTHAVTIEAPEIEVVPSQVHETLALGSALTRSVIISNRGSGNLAFDLAEADHDSPAGVGPDTFGYTYQDSSEGGGPAYEWIEIAPPAGGSGTEITALTGVSRQYFWPIPLPFVFNYYGTDYTELAVSANGVLSFRDRYIGWEDLPIPSPRGYGVERFMAHFWDFLIIDPGAIYYQALDSMFVVEYYQVSRLGGSEPGTWEIVLFENGNILFQYQDVYFAYYWADYGRSATVGIQGDAITGLQYSHSAPALSDGLAICFAYPGQLSDCSMYRDVPWLSQQPVSGTVGADGAGVIDLIFDATVPEVTQTGEYTATLVVVTNDPDENLTMVPVTMTVISPTYGLNLTPQVDTRSGEPGATVTYTLHVTNTGNAFDTCDVALGDYTWPTTAPTAVGPLAAGKSAGLDVTVSIPPSATAGTSDTVTITVASQGDEAQLATASLTTSAVSEPPSYNLFLPLVVKQLMR